MMSAVEQWGMDRAQYFDDKRNAPKPQPVQAPKPQPVQAPKQEPKTQKAEKPKAAQEAPKKREAVEAKWEPVKPTPFQILVSCLGIAIFHGLIQVAAVYTFAMGTLDAQGIIVATMTNAMICGFRLSWNFKQ